MKWKNISSSLVLSASQCWFAKQPLSQTDLACHLKSANLVKSSEVFECFSAVDRKLFTSDPEPYSNKPCAIGCGEVMTSPSTHVLILETLLNPIKNASKILDLGCGLGYLSQCFSLINPSSRIIAVDIHKELVSKARVLNPFKNIEFRHCEAHELIDESFGVINVSFTASEELFGSLCEKIEEKQGVILCPVSLKEGTQWVLFDGKEKFYLGAVAFSPMRVLENLQLDLEEIEKTIKQVYKDTEEKIGRRPNITDLPKDIHELLKRRRRIQGKINLQKPKESS